MLSKSLASRIHPIALAASIGVLIIAVLFFWPIMQLLKQHGFTTAFIRNMITQESIPLHHEYGRINILVLGSPGGTQEGFDLTDTILFISIHARENDMLLLSIPRDLWIPTLVGKINVAYRSGEETLPGGRLQRVKSIVQDVLGQPVHYALRLDFTGFTRIIDVLGGIDIRVEQPIDDQFFPVPGRENDLCYGDPSLSCRYERLQFDPGLQHMDGSRALKYVRSRQSAGEEGNDFSRSRRQQQVLLAVKTKLLSYLTWQHRAKLYEAANELRSATETDMKLSELLFLLRRFTQIPNENIRRLVLDAGDERVNRPGLLINPSPAQYYGAWILVPRPGTFAEIHRYVACHIENPKCRFPL